MAHRVFVYGSLKREFHNHDILVRNGAEFVKETRTSDAEFDLFAMAGGSFPAVTRGHASIQGELYIVDDSTMRDLDRLEGNGHFYQRELVYLDGEEEPAWMYVIIHCESRSRFNVDMDVIDDIVVMNWGDARKMKNIEWVNYRSMRA